MSNPVLTIGSDFRNTGTLRSDGSLYNVASAQSIKATVTNAHSTKNYTSTKTLSINDTGADWGNGVIAFNFSALDTAVIADHVKFPQEAKIEVEVKDANGHFHTFYSDIDIKPGNIT